MHNLSLERITGYRETSDNIQWFLARDKEACRLVYFRFVGQKRTFVGRSRLVDRVSGVS